MWVKVRVRERVYTEWLGIESGFGLGFSGVWSVEIGLHLELGFSVSVMVDVIFWVWVLVRFGLR